MQIQGHYRKYVILLILFLQESYEEYEYQEYNEKVYDNTDVGNVPLRRSLPQPPPLRRPLPSPRLPEEGINAEKPYDDITLLSDKQEHVSNTEMEFLLPITHCIDIFRSAKTPLTDVQRRNSKRLIPEVLSRLDHESVSTYLSCLKDGEERSNRIRLVIVGRKNTGKTCLTKRLLKESLENVQKTNGIEIHTLKCRGKVEERGWVFQDDRTYENEIHSRLLKCCIEKSKTNLPIDSKGYMFSQKRDKSSEITPKPEKVGNELNESIFKEPDMDPETFYQAQEVPVQDFYDLYDIIYADIDDEATAPIALWDFAGDREHFNTHQTFFGQESIYVVVTNVMDIIENDDSEYGLAFWLETIRCNCNLPVEEDYYNGYQEPPVIIVGTHKDHFKGTGSDCETKFQRQVHEMVRNSKIRRNIRNMYVISNTDDTDDQFDLLRGDIVEIAKSRKHWNTKTPARWIHLEKALSDENSLGKPVVAKSDIVEIANHIIQPITDKEEIELFLVYHNGIGTYVYFSDLPEYVVLDPQWLASAFGCIITADQFQKNLVHQTEWEELRQHGRLSEKLLNEIFLQQEVNIKKYRIHLLKIMEKFNIIVRPRTMSDTYEIHEESDYYVPCMIKNTSLSNINETFYSCGSKSSCLCVEFDFLPPSFATQILVACTRYYTVAKGPQTTDGRHPAFYRDFAIYNLDATGCEKLLIANYRNVLQMQIWKWGEPERRSYHDVKAKLIGIIEEMKEIRAQPNLLYELKLKCQYTDYECLDGMVELKVIKPQKEYFCEEHGNTHRSEEIYFDWLGEIEQKIFSREQINATRMAIIILEILTNALYDLLISDCGGFSVKQREECDITYLYAQLRRKNKHIPCHGWGCRWSDIQNSDILIGDDIERIRLARNDMAHSKKFSLDDNKYYDLCGILERVLRRLEIYNGKGKLYTDQMKNVKKKETKSIDWQTYQKKITSEFPRLKMKPSFEVKVGGGITLECEKVVPLPDGSTVYWVKEKNSKEVELTVDETTSNKYKGSQFDYPSLNIFCATKEDEGHYSCKIRYPKESAESMDENITWPKTCLHVNNCKYKVIQQQEYRYTHKQHLNAHYT
ncbi:unnamed protein product [Mytilus coruscus]|uniref:non-specific serine/threonine protein kinase n=1 Tax=Mytilus coruscus TaxID=42192 RepID=A0A6J8CSI8_MYTCO|nr:unnamed protein product [Mytilus coruscus]